MRINVDRPFKPIGHSSDAAAAARAGNAAKVTYGGYSYSHTKGLNDVTVSSNLTPSYACGF
jgi:hypothetical protein